MPLANIIRRQALTRICETGLPLRRVLANDSAGLAILNAQRNHVVKLGADVLGRRLVCLAQGAEEALARSEGIGETRVCRDNNRVIRRQDLADNGVAVFHGRSQFLEDVSLW